jgi:MerR family transcriptional regulator, copper efflux regulator
VQAEPAELIPIDEVARRLGLRASAIRYYEERVLVLPASRHSGRRWYGPAEIRRLAVIQYWQRWGAMSLEEIGDILAGPAATRDWAEILQERIDTLRLQAERVNAAREHLEHVLSHHRDSSPDGCSHYESLIFGGHQPEAAWQHSANYSTIPIELLGNAWHDLSRAQDDYH